MKNVSLKKLKSGFKKINCLHSSFGKEHISTKKKNIVINPCEKISRLELNQLLPSNIYLYNDHKIKHKNKIRSQTTV